MALFFAMRRQVAARKIECACIRLEQIDGADAGILCKQRIGKETPASPKIGCVSGQVRRQVGREQLGSRVDPVPGEHTRTALETPVEDRAWRIGIAPLRKQCGIDAGGVAPGPEHAAMELGQAALEAAGQSFEIAFQRLRAFVVGHGGDDLTVGFAGIERTRQQGARLLALACGQHQHLRVPRVR